MTQHFLLALVVLGLLTFSSIPVSVLNYSKVAASRGKGHMNNISQQLVEGADLSLQEQVLLLCGFLPLFCDLQCCHQLRIFHIQFLQQAARLCVLHQLKTRQTGSVRCNAAEATWTSVRCGTTSRTDLLFQLLDLLLQDHLDPLQLGLQLLHPLLQARERLLILILNTQSSLNILF